ncbi:MAG TPA: hypothetical protein VFQ61_00600 [Polyangiaceae bacterium]|nr:hypothetical protein [Polyangiaceae bacterium]
MPFKSPYKQKIDDGDLIYGIHAERKKLIEYLFKTSEVLMGTVRPPPYLTVDVFDREPVRTVYKQHESLEKGSGKRSEQVLAWREFHQENAKHPKYKSYTEATEGGKKSEQGVEAVLSESVYNSIIRRKCKFGLYWTIKRGKHIHFCLDGLSMGAIAGKSFKDDKGSGSDKLRAVTGSELRWIYRHRNVNAVQLGVQFWHNKAPAGPPWNEPEMQELIKGKWVKWRESWASYKPKHEPSTLELDVDRSNATESALLGMTDEKATIVSCSLCGGGDIELHETSKGVLVCTRCVSPKNLPVSTVSLPLPRVSDSVDARLSCSKCKCTRASQTSNFFTRWHECPSCGVVYCNICGSELGNEGLWFERGGFCECGGITELIY